MNAGTPVPALWAEHAELTLRGAQTLLDYGENAARERGVRLCLAVVDRSGALLAFRRMDGAAPVAIDVAIGKARSAAMLRGDSRAFEELVDGQHPSMLATPGVLPLRGGVPVRVGAAVLGAVGASGATGPVDEAVAVLMAGGVDATEVAR